MNAISNRRKRPEGAQVRWLVLLCGSLSAGCANPGDPAKGPAGSAGTGTSDSKSNPLVAASSASAAPALAPVGPSVKVLGHGVFAGFCEASAVIPWEGGYLVADNEAEETLYSFDADLKPRDYAFKPRYEARDVEALVDLGSKKVALIGSHSTSADGTVKPKRSFVQLEGARARTVNLTGCPACEGARAIAPKKGGLSIEGAARWGATLWLGVRSPLVAGKALLLQMKGDLGGDGSIDVEKVVPIDLGGRGVRDLVIRDGQLFVLAGPADATAAPHALYRVKDASGAVDLVTSALPERSEGIAPTPSAGEWLVVVDGDGKPKEPCTAPAEWFRLTF